MRKIIMAALLLATPTAANAATLSVSLDRYKMIVEQSKSICQTVIDQKGSAKELLDRYSAPLNLNTDEQIIMISLCILYTQGRLDEGKV